MHDSLPSFDLAAHSKALIAAGLAVRLVTRVPAPLKPIAEQAIRAAASVPANLAAGHPSGHGDGDRDGLDPGRVRYIRNSKFEIDPCPSHVILDEPNVQR